MKLLAPLLPHITEEIYQENFVRLDKAKSIHVSKWPISTIWDDSSERKGELARDIIAAVRNWKSEGKMALNEAISSIEVIDWFGWRDKSKGRDNEGWVDHFAKGEIEEKVVP
jgi:valyl-tRNA synthetase